MLVVLACPELMSTILTLPDRATTVQGAKSDPRTVDGCDSSWVTYDLKRQAAKGAR